MAVLSGLSVVGGVVACCGMLFFLFCVALVVWYAVRQPKQQVSASAPAPVVQATIEHPTAATSHSEPSAAPAPPVVGGTPGADE